MKKHTDTKIASQISQNSSSLSRLKKVNPSKYEMIRLGSYIVQEKIKEDELLNLLETYRNMKNQVNKA